MWIHRAIRYSGERPPYDVHGVPRRDLVIEREGLDRRLDDGARDHAAPTFTHGLRPALNGFEAVSAGEKSDQEEGHSHLCRLLRVVCVQEPPRASREAPL